LFHVTSPDALDAFGEATTAYAYVANNAANLVDPTGLVTPEEPKPKPKPFTFKPKGNGIGRMLARNRRGQQQQHNQPPQPQQQNQQPAQQHGEAPRPPSFEDLRPEIMNKILGRGGLSDQDVAAVASASKTLRRTVKRTANYERRLEWADWQQRQRNFVARNRAALQALLNQNNQ
jgi:hypothetical protein